MGSWSTAAGIYAFVSKVILRAKSHPLNYTFNLKYKIFVPVLLIAERF